MPKGEHFDRLREEFLAAGGDLSRCPFDTEDYKYEDPPYDDEDEGLAEKSAQSQYRI